MTEKVIGTRLDVAVVEALEQLATLKDNNTKPVATRGCGALPGCRRR
ncbi:MAG: hypothetical protein KME05_00400 [Gloeocapsa sp. UFS-A4-WI-NPMV-4B04]|nr:hypothetical protein [Gloeocapsa sp. UFS-A4-WI-NPMV-4B04]